LVHATASRFGLSGSPPIDSLPQVKEKPLRPKTGWPTDPNVKQSLTKRYPDGRTLTLLVVDDKLVEKSLTFRWDWDYDLIEKDKEKGKGASFNYWAKGGLEVSLTYFGSYLSGKMFT
jgi:hypothetical protein